MALGGSPADFGKLIADETERQGNKARQHQAGLSDLPSKPASGLRGVVCRSLQAFSRSFNLRLSRPVTARPHFCR
jgi:hypothetical protein